MVEEKHFVKALRKWRMWLQVSFSSYGHFAVAKNKSQIRP